MKKTITECFSNFCDDYKIIEYSSILEDLLEYIGCKEYHKNFKLKELPLMQVTVYYNILDDLVLVCEMDESGSYWQLFTSVDSYNESFSI